MMNIQKLAPYRESITGVLLVAREAAMAPIRPVLRSSNFTEQQWRVLRVLSDEGPLDIAALCTKAVLHGPSISRILKELSDRGLISREADAQDRRRFFVDITSEGRLAIKKTATDTLVLLNKYVDAFGKERLENLLSELTAFSEELADFHPMDRTE